MAFSPEERQKIYDEEKARLEAQEQLKKEAEAAKTKKAGLGCLGCLGAVAVVFFIIQISGSLNQGTKPGSGTGSVPSPTSVQQLSVHELWAKGDWNGVISQLVPQYGAGTLDAQGKQTLYAAYVNAGNDALKRGATSDAEVKFILAQALDQSRGEAKEGLKAVQRAGALLALLPGGGCTKSYGFITYEGRVQNISGKPLSNVVAVTIYYTSDGTFVKSADALIDYNPILPGQTSPFKTITTDNPAMQKCGAEFKELFGGKIPHFKE